MKSHTTQWLAAACLSGFTLAAMAQTPATPHHGGMAGHQQGQHMGQNTGHQMGHGDPAKKHERMAQRHTKHLSELKTKLNLAANQDGAWATFASTMQPPADMMARHATQRQNRAELEKLNTPERIDRMRAMRTARMNHMNTEMTRREDAAKAFYATLTPEQQKVFDTEHQRHMVNRSGPHGMIHTRHHSHHHGH